MPHQPSYRRQGTLLSVPQDRYELLQAAIRERRIELGMSISAAARIAGVSRATWTGAERGERATEAYNFGAIERALRWPAGTIERLLAGGTLPELNVRVPIVYAPPGQGQRTLLEEIQRIEGLRLPAETRLELFSALLRLWSEREQELGNMDEPDEEDEGQAAG